MAFKIKIEEVLHLCFFRLRYMIRVYFIIVQDVLRPCDSSQRQKKGQKCSDPDQLAQMHMLIQIHVDSVHIQSCMSD